MQMTTRHFLGKLRGCSLAAALVGLFLAGPLAAQETNPEPAPELQPEPQTIEGLTTTAQKVEVAAVADEAIGARLQQILETTNRFTNIAVRVENGVVFLSGQTTREGYLEWAQNLAMRTEDVVAVINDIEIDVGHESLWDFEPAVQEVRRLWRSALQYSPLIVVGLVLLGLTALGAGITGRVSEHILRPRMENTMLRGVVRTLLVIVTGLIGLYLVLRVTGLTRLAVTMLGGTGILGLVIGFAFRDIAENFLASLLISVQKPFRVGDTIEVAGYTGIVQKVTTRGTVLMAFDGNFIQLSNSTVYKSTIRNFTSNPKCRLDFVVGVGYDSDLTAVQRLLLDVAKNHPAVYKDPEPLVWVENLGSSTIQLHVYFWINIAEYSQFKVKSSVMRQCVTELLKAKINLPDDNREVVFPQSVPVRLLAEDEARREIERCAEEEARKDAARAPAPAETEAEGALHSEIDELQAQAQEAGLPEAGKDILAEGDTATGPIPARKGNLANRSNNRN